jgi:hypothetical protein
MGSTHCETEWVSEQTAGNKTESDRSTDLRSLGSKNENLDMIQLDLTEPRSKAILRLMRNQSLGLGRESQNRTSHTDETKVR